MTYGKSQQGSFDLKDLIARKFFYIYTALQTLETLLQDILCKINRVLRASSDLFSPRLYLARAFGARSVTSRPEYIGLRPKPIPQLLATQYTILRNGKQSFKNRHFCHYLHAPKAIKRSSILLLLRTVLASYWQSLVHLNCACVY